ncbi:MAG: DUF5683 domain-containing protein [Bacteroidales bacterium]|nr:DUF5683 domain-containing protein [Bacteroidales bacterium]MDD6539122.1 DUF5683 domain-containing protein [Bacteroidales bacterium]MDD6555234.1 DUF5683 domain-containing protein [Bacteroidales bacterium]MDD6774551.1 DUF5683 domain-containing protein [Bacteroidales bacterium]
MRRFLNRLILCYLACIAAAPLCGRTTRSTTETAADPSATVLSVRMVGESNDTVKGLQDLARDTTTYRPVLLADSLASSHTDSLLTAPVDTARLRAVTDSVSKLAAVPPIRPKFVPDPKRALWLSLILPGAGQIYNRKYWKLPIIYGGFLGCAYALIWNQQMYRDYSQAYLDIMDDDPRTCSYLDMLPPRYDITGKEEQFKNVFKRKKDFYRRYRDLSAFCFVGVYILSVIDAYVDAQLSAFDITPDLSMRIAPTVLGSSPTFGSRSSTAYGVGCSLNF